MDTSCPHLAPPAQKFGVRHVQTGVMALSSFGIYALRISLSVAIVGMTDIGTASNVTGSGSTTDLGPAYDWDERTQGLLLSSFFWGYVLTQVPAGILTQRLGGHRFLTAAVFLTSVTCVLLPPCAYLGGWQLVCANRMLQGVAQGFVYPSLFTMMGLWTPTQERSRLSGVILSAQNVGPVIATPLAGWLAAYCGWPSIFYWFGAAGIGISAIIFWYAADSPAAHRTITLEERQYIQSSLGGPREKFPVPWREMLLSGPVWATNITFALQGGVYLTFLTKIPTYLSSVLKFDIKDNGILTAVPYLASWLLGFFFSWSCDWLVERNFLNLTQARKLFNSIAHVGSAVAMILLAYSSSPALSVTLLTAAIGLLSGTYPGTQSNFIDLTPNMSGTIFAIANFLAAMVGVIGPIFVSFVVTEKGSVTQWRTVFFVFAAVMVLSNLHFVVCGSAEVQPWNFPKNEMKSKHDSQNEDLHDNSNFSRKKITCYS